MRALGIAAVILATALPVIAAEADSNAEAEARQLVADLRLASASCRQFIIESTRDPNLIVPDPSSCRASIGNIRSIEDRLLSAYGRTRAGYEIARGTLPSDFYAGYVATMERIEANAVAGAQPPMQAERPTMRTHRAPEPFESLLATVESLPREGRNKGVGPTNPRSQKASISEIDAIRAEIERELLIPPGIVGLTGAVAHLRVRISPDGTVTTAAILDRERYKADANFRLFADAVRTAVLKASPLHYPRGKYDTFKEMELSFRPVVR